MSPAFAELYLVLHTHWDREWYRTAEGFRQRLVRLVDELLDEPPAVDASFLLDGQAIVLEDYLAVRPERAGDVARLLRDGRLEAGPWYVLADNLIPSGEALVRNLLMGQQVVRRLRGEPPPVLYCPDSFGHPAVLPDLAAGFGFSLVVLWRGLGGGRAPALDVVRWKGTTGCSVVVYHLPPDGYEFGSSLPADASGARARWAHLAHVLAPRSATGVAMLLSGADHHARQRDDVRALAELTQAAAPVRVRGASLASAARAIVESSTRVNVPELAGELRDSYGYTWTLQGTCGTRAAQKRRSAWAERSLTRDVEPWVALACNGGDAAARAVVDHAWRTLLHAHPHDTLCGTSIDAVALAFDARIAAVEVEAEGVRQFALASLLGHDSERARMMPTDWRPAVVTRNRVARARAGVVELTLRTTLAAIAVGPGSGDKQGARKQPSAWAVEGMPLQILSETERVALTESARAYPKADLVREACALGWLDTCAGFEVRSIDQRAGASPRIPHPVVATTSALDNGLIRVEVGADGSVDFIDLQQPRRIHGLLSLERQRDVGDLYTPALREPLPVRPARRGALLHPGPLRGAIALELDAGADTSANGSVAVDLELDADSRFVRIRVRGDNHLRDQRTRLCFHTGIAGAATLADAAFHPVVRTPLVVDRRDEEMEHVVPTAPMHRWVARLGHEVTAVVVSDGLAEYESTVDGDIAITLVRAVGELSRADLPERPGHAGWPAPTPAAQSLGPYEACLAVRLFGRDSGEVREDIERFAEEVLLPLVGETLRSNLLPPRRAGGIALDGDGLAFSAAMPARASGWIVLRCVNRRDTTVQGCWTLGLVIHEAVMARLDETPVEHATTSGSTISFTALPRAIVTVLARVGETST